MSSVVFDAPVGLFDRDSTRRTAVLSDGSIVVFAKLNETQIACYHSTDRVNWTQKFVIDLVTSSFSGFSCAIEPGNHLQVVYQTTDTNSNLVWQRFTYSAGNWTAQTAESVYNNAARITGSVDIDVLGTNVAACIIIWREFQPSGNGQRICSKARGSNNTWGAEFILQSSNFSNKFSPNESVFASADSAGPTSNVQNVYLGAVFNSQSGSLGAVTGVGRWNVQTGAYETGSFVTAADTFPEHVHSGTVPGASHRILSFPAAGAAWYGVSFSNFSDNSCSIKTWRISISGGVLTVTAGPNFRMPAATFDLIKPTAVKLSNNKIACFTRGLSAGGVYSAVADMINLSVSTAFIYSMPLLAVPLNPYAGAQRHVGTNADIAMIAMNSGITYHEYNIAPASPTNIRPSGVTVTTDLPTLQATLPTTQFTVPRKAHWEVAPDASFATIKTVIESDADLNTSEVHVEDVPPASELSQGTWFVRARTLDAFGTPSSFSSAVSFAISHPPVAQKLTPDNITREYGVPTTFDWDFTDASSVDFQTAFRIIIEKVADNVTILDTGKILSALTTHDLTVPLSGKDTSLRWKIQLWDSDDVVGPFSEYKIFKVSDAPVVTITSPASGAEVNTPTPTITWTSSTTQTAYRIQIFNNATVPPSSLYDSGILTGGSGNFTLPSGIIYPGQASGDPLATEAGEPIVTEQGDPIVANDAAGAYSVTVTVYDSAGLVGSDNNAFQADWNEPAQPAFTGDSSSFPTLGYHEITWNNLAQDAEFVAYKIYRRILGNTRWEKIYETSQTQSSYTHQDWLANSDEQYEYTVVQSATRFGVPVESVRGNAVVLGAETADYYLLHPTNSSLNLKLSHVTSEDFVDEYESEVLNLIGRGRKTDYGTRWGYVGTLVCEVWDEPGRTAREVRLLVEQLKRSKTTMYLRNPFGDRFLVDMRDISIDRTPGVGTREHHTLTIPYVELDGNAQIAG